MEFLFENPFILVIIIGILSSIYKNIKGNHQDTGRKTVKSNRSQTPAKQGRRTNANEQNWEPAKRISTIQEEYVKAREVAEEQAIEWRQLEGQNTERIRQKQNPETSKESISLQSATENNSLDEQNLIDSIIWSEILGPPRAKKPHGLVRR